MRWRPTLRWRRNWKLPVALAAATGTLLVVGGSFRVIPYVSDLATLPQRETTTNIGGDVELLALLTVMWAG